MTLVIDTGRSETDPRRHMPDWFIDRNDTGDDLRLIHDYGYYLIGELRAPKTMATVRRHVIGQWAFLRTLAEQQPDIFDEFQVAYAERFLGAD